MATPHGNGGKPRPARRSTGGVVTGTNKALGVSFGIRFSANGKRRFQHLGYSSEGMTMERAEAELAYVIEKVNRGEWEPPAPPEPEPEPVPYFGPYADAWFDSRKLEGGRSGHGLSPSGAADLDWQLRHLKATFARMRLDRIGVRQVDEYRRARVREGVLNATSINKHLAMLASVLEEAIEHGLIAAPNPARGKRRRLPAVRPRRTYLDRAEHIAALLDAAGALDAERAKRTRPFRRTMLATLTLAGLRIDECLRLRWRHIDLAGGRLKVPGTKTAAAERTVPLLPLLRDELLAHAARRRDADPNALVFATSKGGKIGATNVRRRVLGPAVERANAALAERGSEPLPEGLTPHSLRRTCASVLVALGWDPARVMRVLGHTTAGFTLSVYAAAMDWAEGEAERLRALVEGRDLALTGTGASDGTSEPLTAPTPESEDSAL